MGCRTLHRDCGFFVWQNLGEYIMTRHNQFFLTYFNLLRYSFPADMKHEEGYFGEVSEWVRSEQTKDRTGIKRSPGEHADLLFSCSEAEQYGEVTEWVRSEQTKDRTGIKRSPGEHADLLFSCSEAEQYGEVTEWSNVPDLKSGVAGRLPWVRIPPSPPSKNRPCMSGFCFCVVA